jgi:hypothetical protein
VLSRWVVFSVRAGVCLPSPVPSGERPSRRAAGNVAGLDITADATGLTLFATVRRADEPG